MVAPPTPAVSVITAVHAGLMHFVPAVPNLDYEDNMRDDKDMATEGMKDQLKGAAKQAEGRVRGTVGAATGDTSEQIKGKAQEIKGKVQQGIGKAKQRNDPNPGVDDE
jgi:uncharacterized protein YjbJ (UPF0337 family)